MPQFKIALCASQSQQQSETLRVFKSAVLLDSVFICVVGESRGISSEFGSVIVYCMYSQIKQ